MFFLPLSVLRPPVLMCWWRLGGHWLSLFQFVCPPGLLWLQELTGVFWWQEELAFVFEMLQQFEDALVQYDELDALFSQYVVNFGAGGESVLQAPHFVLLSSLPLFISASLLVLQLIICCCFTQIIGAILIPIGNKMRDN